MFAWEAKSKQWKSAIQYTMKVKMVTSYYKVEHSELWNLSGANRICWPGSVESGVLLRSCGGVTLLFFNSHLSSLSPWWAPVIIDICVFIAVVGQVTARVWLWPLVHHLHYHGHTHRFLATQVSAWRLRKVEWNKVKEWPLMPNFFPTSHFV